MKRQFKQNRGFTLVEAIVSIAIVGIIIVPLGVIFYQAINHISTSKEKLKMTQLAQNYVEYTKGVSINSTNGFEIPDGYTEANKGEEAFYYIKSYDGADAIDGKYEVSIKVYPNAFSLDSKNELAYEDKFKLIYDTADTNKISIPALGDLSGVQRNIELTYQEVAGNPDKINIVYNVTGGDHYTESEEFDLSDLNGQFVIFYNAFNYDPSTMNDTIKIINKTDINLTVYLLKNMSIKHYPTIKLQEGYATIIKDSVFEGASERRLYKVLVEVKNSTTSSIVEVEATKNQQY